MEHSAGIHNSTPSTLLILSNGTPNQTTTQLLRGLATRIERVMRCEVRLRNLPPGKFAKFVSALRSEWGNLKALRHHKMVMTHSAALFSLPTLIAAKLSGKTTVIIVWDIYPESFGWSGLRAPLAWLAMLFENLALTLADLVIINSEDYLPFVRQKGAETIQVTPMWTQGALPLNLIQLRASTTLKIAWAGQINSLRDLTGTMRNLLAHYIDPVELHLFSPDGPPPNLYLLERGNDQFYIEKRGFLPLADLSIALSKLDFGLVSIDPAFPLPVFPSKIMTYLLAGIPVLFEGPRTPTFDRLFSDRGIGLHIEMLETTDIEEFRRKFPQRRRAYLDWVEQETIALADQLARLANRC